MTPSPTKAGAHTPGPWSVGGPTGKLNQIAINPCIGCAYGAGDEVAANAALIAAAPLMLEALRRCKFDSLNMTLEDLEFCRAAVAAATGSQGGES